MTARKTPKRGRETIKTTLGPARPRVPATWREPPGLPRPESSGRVRDCRLASCREFGDTNR